MFNNENCFNKIPADKLSLSVMGMHPAARKFPKKTLSLGVLALGLAAVSVGTYGQSDTTTGARAALEEVVIRARRVEESLQNVPVAVSAVSADQLERSFLTDSTGLAQFAPNLVLDKVEAGTAGGGAFSIRGISYQDVEKAFDPTVLVFVDDIAIGTGTGNVMSLLDVEGIEILRGPQGTLFGKNAVGGIINIHRKKPETGITSGRIRGSAGNFNTRNIEGYVNLGGENIALKLTGARLDHDGYFENTTLNKDQDDRVEERFGAHLLWNVSDSFALELQADHLEQKGTPNPILNISDRAAVDGSGDVFCAFLGQCAPVEGLPQSGDKQVAVGENNTFLVLESDTYIGRATWDINDSYQLMYIVGYQDSFDDTEFDFDGSPLPLYSARKPSDYDQTSHEFRIARRGDTLSGQAGIYLWNADSFSVNFGPGLVDRARAESDSFSIYGEADYRFRENWVLTAGLRYIEETKKIEKFVDDGAGAVAIPEGTRAKRTDDDVIYRLGLRHEFDNGNMVYATYSTGFRSGGFSPRAATTEVLLRGQEPEELTNYEVGAKSRWFDNRLQLNLALFHMVYDNMQIETSIPSNNPANPQQQGFDNIGKAAIQGAEIDMVGILAEGWTLTGTLGLLNAEYDEFFTDLYLEGFSRDFSDLDLRRAPEVTYSVGLDHERQLGAGAFNAHLGYNWRTDYEGTLNNHPGTGVDSFGILEASLSYAMNNWAVSIFGRNLTDEDAFSHTFAVAPNAQGGSVWKFATPRTPRTYGLQVTFDF